MKNFLWFTENFEIDKGRLLQVAVKKVLEQRKSEFQQIEVFETVAFGRMLVLDGIIMVTQHDNFAYHEMMVHVPMNVHPCPKRVLIVGGGDGGALKEVLKYDSVEEVVLCEIDAEVIVSSQKYFPEFRKSFLDKRTQIVIRDAAEYVKQQKNAFDVICVDSSDPVGPAEVLFRKEFYTNMYKALTADGIVTSQSESMYYHRDFISKLFKQNREIYKFVDYYYTIIPTYPSGTIGFSFCSKKYKPLDNLDNKRIKKLKKLQYYNQDIHKASFMHPEFFKKFLS